MENLCVMLLKVLLFSPEKRFALTEEANNKKTCFK